MFAVFVYCVYRTAIKLEWRDNAFVLDCVCCAERSYKVQYNINAMSYNRMRVRYASARARAHLKTVSARRRMSAAAAEVGENRADVRDLPIVLAIILVAARILQFAPTFAVPARRHQHQVACVVQMEQRVSRLGADAVNVPEGEDGKIKKKQRIRNKQVRNVLWCALGRATAFACAEL